MCYGYNELLSRTLAGDSIAKYEFKQLCLHKSREYLESLGYEAQANTIARQIFDGRNFERFLLALQEEKPKHLMPFLAVWIHRQQRVIALSTPKGLGCSLSVRRTIAQAFREYFKETLTYAYRTYYRKTLNDAWLKITGVCNFTRKALQDYKGKAGRG